MLNELKEGRFLGHPVHTMLVHFPAGLFLSAVLFDLVGWATGEEIFHATSVHCMAAGAGIGAVAAGFGFMDLTRLGRSPAFTTGWRHGALETGALLLFALLAAWRLQEWPETAVPGTAEWAGALMGFIVLVTGNWLGGELVFRHGAGARKEDQP